MRANAMRAIGRFQLEGALQSAHVDRCRSGTQNWAQVVQLYDALAQVAPSPVVAINRAVALAEVQGAVAGLAAMPDTANDPRLVDYQPYWAARARLLARTGDGTAATTAYEIAIGLERDDAVRAFLRGQMALIAEGSQRADGGPPP